MQYLKLVDEFIKLSILIDILLLHLIFMMLLDYLFTYCILLIRLLLSPFSHLSKKKIDVIRRLYKTLSKSDSWDFTISRNV